MPAVKQKYCSVYLKNMEFITKMYSIVYNVDFQFYLKLQFGVSRNEFLTAFKLESPYQAEQSE